LRKLYRILFATLGIAALQAAAALTVMAANEPPVASGDEFALLRWTTDGGGGISAAATFRLQGTIAQADASTDSASGGQVALTGGFWTNRNFSPTADAIFSDGFEPEGL